MTIKNISTVTLSLLIILNIANFSKVLISFEDSFIYLFLFSKESLSLICHQQQEKLFSLLGFHSILCSRCTGIYFGALVLNVALLFFSFEKVNWEKFFYLSIFLMIIDIIFYQLGFYKYSQIIAASTGILLGAASLGLLLSGLKLFLQEINREK